MSGDPGNNQINGSESSDNTIGSHDADQIQGKGGDDIITPGAGVDIVDGGAGNDRIVFTDTDSVDEIYFIHGDSQNDIIDLSALVPASVDAATIKNFVKINTGGIYIDTEGHGQFSSASQIARFASGNPPLSVMATVQVAVTNSVIDFDWTETATIPLTDAHDYISDNVGNENTVAGSIQSDTLTGTAAADYMLGNGGNDVIDGGAGADYYDGGAGSDQYVLANTDAVDTLKLKVTGNQQDSIDVSQLLPSDIEITEENIDNYVQVTEDGVFVDSTGQADFSEPNQVARFTEDTMFDDSHVMVHVAENTTIVLEIVSSVGVHLDSGETFESDQVLAQTLESPGLDSGLGSNIGMLRSSRGQKLNLRLDEHNLTEAHGGAGDEQLDASSIVDRTGSQSAASADLAIRLYGRDGNDTLIGNNDGGMLDGGAGNDRIEAGQGRNLLVGGSGSDEFALTFESSASEIKSDKIYDFSSQEGNRDLLDLQNVLPLEATDQNIHSYVKVTDMGVFVDLTGNARFNEENQLVRFGERVDIDDLINLRLANGTTIQINRNEAVSIVHGAAGDDVIRGDEGSNTLYGYAGDDTLDGDGLGKTRSADHLFGGDGNDTLLVDKLDLENGTVEGGAGFDGVIINADAGESVTVDLHASGVESVTGSDSNDVLDGSGFTDSNGSYNKKTGVYEANGTQQLNLYGNAGKDTLIGGDARDHLEGGTDDDILSGGLGEDVYIGGDGNDTFILADDGELDIIWDFTSSGNRYDVLDISAFTSDDFDYNTLGDYFSIDSKYVYFDKTGSGTFTVSKIIAVLGGATAIDNDHIKVEIDGTRIGFNPDTAEVVYIDSHAPTVSVATTAIAEDSVAGTIVGQASYTDEDGADAVEYTITSGNEQGFFAIDSNTGQVTLTDAGAAAIDYEAMASHALQIIATDRGFSSNPVELTINLVDINDIAPAVSVSASPVEENSPQGTVVGLVSATDSDTTDDALTYAISGGNDSGYFTIDVTTGEVKLTAEGAANFDYETAASYNLSVTATDGVNVSTPMDFSVQLINLNETAPEARGAVSQSVAEDISLTVTEADFLANAYDADGNSDLSVSNITVTTGQINIVDNNDGTWTITPQSNWSGIAQLSFDISDGIYTTSSHLDLTVSAVADTPTLSVNGTDEGQLFTLNLDAVFDDFDGSETHSVVLGAIPSGTIISDGSFSETVISGDLDITGWDHSSLTVLPPQNIPADFTLLINATATESDGAESVVTEHVDVFIDRPVLSIEPRIAEMPVQLNTTTVGSQEQLDLAIRPDGGFVAVWIDVGADDERRVMGRRYDEDSKPESGEFVIDSGSSVAREPKVSVRDDGSFVVAWGDGQGSKGTVEARSYHADGSASTDVKTTLSGDTYRPEVLALESGDYVVATYDNWHGKRTEIQIYDDNGNPASGVITTGSVASKSDIDYQLISLSDGNWAHAFRNAVTGDIVLNIYDASGNGVGHSTLTASEAEFDLVSLGGDGIAVVYRDEASVKLQLFNNDGSQNGDETDLDITAGAGLVVETLGDGGVFIGWKENDGLYGQHFLADGTAAGGKTLLTDDDTADGLSVIEMEDGSLKLGWHSSGIDGDGNAVVSSNLILPVDDLVNGTVVAQARASGGSDSNPLTYSLTDDAGGRYEINSNTGEITIADSSNIDYAVSPSYTLTIAVTDGTVTTSNDYTIYNNNNNKAPETTDSTIVAREDISYTFTESDFPIVDPNANDYISEVRIESLPGNGTLTLNSAVLNVGTVVSVEDIQAGHLTYLADNNDNGSAYSSFTYNVADRLGLYSSIARKMIIDVSPENDAPTSSDSTLSLNEDTPHTFNADEFGFSDIDDGDSQQSITITQLPANGTLKLGSEVVSNNDVIQSAEISQLTFTPIAHEHGGNYANLKFTVSDGELSSAEQTLTFNVTAVADVAVISGRDSVPELTAGDFIKPDSYELVVSSQSAINSFKADLNTEDNPFYTHDTILLRVSSGNWNNWFSLPNDPSFEGKMLVLDDNAGFYTNVSYEGKSVRTDTGQEVVFIYKNGHWFTDREMNGLTEDNASELTFHGVLDVQDPDSNEAQFNAETISGDYGSLTINASGSWNYTADNMQAVINELDEGDTLTDTFTVQSVDGTTHNIRVTINGTNDAPHIITEATADTFSVPENSLNDVVVGQVNSTDIEGHSYTYRLIDDANGRFSIDSVTGEIRVADGSQLNHEVNAQHTITIEVTDDYGAASNKNFIINVTDVAEAAIIGGDDEQAAFADGEVLTIGGALTIFDEDEGEAAFVETTLDGVYGILMLDSGGGWAYEGVNGSETIQPMQVGESVTDSFTVESLDGTTHEVVITIEGSNDASEISLTSQIYTYEDGSGELSIIGNLEITDIDNETLQKAEIKISNNYTKGEDELLFIDQNGISGSWDTWRGVLILSGEASIEDYEAAIESVSYINYTASPNTETRKVTVKVNDGADDSNTNNIWINLVDVNAAPVISGVGSAIESLLHAENRVGTSQNIQLYGYEKSSWTKGNIVEVTLTNTADRSESYVISHTITDNRTYVLPSQVGSEILSNPYIGHEFSWAKRVGGSGYRNVLQVDDPNRAPFEIKTVYKNSEGNVVDSHLSMVRNTTYVKPDGAYNGAGKQGVAQEELLTIPESLDVGQSVIINVENIEVSYVISEGDTIDDIRSALKNSMESYFDITNTVSISTYGTHGLLLKATHPGIPFTASGITTPAADSFSISVGEHIVSNELIGVVGASDKDGASSSLVYSLLDDADGKFSINESGEIRVLSPLDYETTTAYTITVQVSDGEASSTQNITIDVMDMNDRPDVGDIDLANTNENTSYLITGSQLIANATDLEGDTLIVKEVSLQNLGHGSVVDNGDATWTYIPMGDFSGEDVQFDFTVSDGTDGNDIAAVAVIDVIEATTEGNDIISAGAGDNIITGGGGIDIFYWDVEHLGTVEQPAEDSITDFHTGENGDVINLSDILMDYNQPLQDYLSLNFENGDTIIDVKPDGDSGVTQKIKLEGVDLSDYGGGTSDAEILNNLLNDGNLQLDS